MTSRHVRRSEEYLALLEFAQTEHEAEKLKMCAKHGITEAARKMGLHQSAVSRTVQAIEVRAAHRGYAPNQDLTRPVAPGQYLKGASTLYKGGEDDPWALQWVKSNADAEAAETVLRAMVDAFKEDVPKAKPVPKPKGSRPDDLMNVHILTDHHLGMMAWHKESGEDYDIKIAEDLLVAWFERGCRLAPAAEFGVLAQLGDFLHQDTLEALTPASKHVLDTDSRFQKIVQVAIRVLRRVLHMMLTKYGTVHVLMADANHDPASAIWLREMFASFYGDDPRVKVDNSADTYYCIEHGLTSIFFHHGHRKGPKAVDDVFVAKFRELFGRTKFSYGHTGHMHHKFMQETNLMVVEQHRTMAAKDAYAAKNGWMAGRSAPIITYHKQYGEVGRIEITPEMCA